MKRVELKIQGQVQGVFFRVFTKLKANEFDLVGWVRNEPDGSVRVVAEGPKEKIEEFIEWCKKGPALAKVKRIDVIWQEATGEFEGFNIIY